MIFPCEGHFGSPELTGQSKKFRRVYETPQEYLKKALTDIEKKLYIIV